VQGGRAASHGRELWRHDPATGMTSMVDIRTATLGSSPARLASINGVVYFAAYTVTTGRELWKYDPATAILGEAGF
jgi:ELWxxDGT repeat protein